MDTRTLPIRLPISGYDELKNLADEEGRSLSDVTRTALEEYAQRRGKKLKLNIQRGGLREPKANRR